MLILKANANNTTLDKMVQMQTTNYAMFINMCNSNIIHIN